MGGAIFACAVLGGIVGAFITSGQDGYDKSDMIVGILSGAFIGMLVGCLGSVIFSQ